MARLPLWWRFAVLLLGILILIWTPIEDRSVTGVLIFAALICILGALAGRAVVRDRWGAPARQEGQLRPRTMLRVDLPVWLIAGLVVTPVAFLFMAIKTGMHGHGTPDYTPAQMVRILYLAPLWILAGLIFGLIASFWQK